MALDSILLNAMTPSPAKSTSSQGANSMAPGGTNGFGNTARADYSGDTADAAGRSGGTASNHSASSNDSAPADARHSSSGSSSSSSETERATRSSTPSGSSNKSTGASRSSDEKTHAAGKPRGGDSSRDKTNSTQRGSQTQRARGKASGTADDKSQSTGPTFLQALAQSQADAKPADTIPTTSAEQGTDGKPKSIHGDAPDGSASLAFLPQSLAAAMAGAQPQPTAPTAQTAPTATDSADADSTVKALSGPGSSATQAMIGSLEKGAEELKAAAATAADGVQGHAQTATPTATAMSPDGTNAAAVAFQAHMSVSSHFQQPPIPVAAHKVEASVGTPAFTDEVGGKITWLANQGIQSATLQLSPEHLGPVNVHISVQDGSATVSFNAAHADTRTALEQALPRLREMFSTQGLTLTDASVSHQSPRGQPQKHAISSIGAIGGASDDSNATSITSVASTRLGLLDTYA